MGDRVSTYVCGRCKEVGHLDEKTFIDPNWLCPLCTKFRKSEILHKLLVSYQTLYELQRKTKKALRIKQNMWTQEEIDLGSRIGAIQAARTRWE